MLKRDLYKTILEHYIDIHTTNNNNNDNVIYYNKSRKMEKEDIPLNVNHLIYNTDYNIEPNVIPDNITHITFGTKESLGYNFTKIKLMEPNVLPKNLKILDMENMNIKKINKNVLPNKLTHIYFSHGFNSKLKGIIPKSVIYIKFGYSFTKKIKKNDLPKNLKYLQFGKKYNKPIKNLPENLKTLIFGYHFNQPIHKEDLPNNIERLGFDHDFNQIINKNNVPNNLKSIYFFSSSNFDIRKQYNELCEMVNEINYFIDYEILCRYNNIYPHNILINEYMEMKIPLFYYVYCDEMEAFGQVFSFDDNCNIVNYVNYLDNNITNMNVYNKRIIDESIDNFISKHDILYKELCKKVLSPNRLENIAKQYNISIIELLEYY